MALFPGKEGTRLPCPLLEGISSSAGGLQNWPPKAVHPICFSPRLMYKPTTFYDTQIISHCFAFLQFSGLRDVKRILYPAIENF